MKLKNKKTGEIVIASVTRVVSGVDFDCGQTLAELNAEWEDVPEEPRTHWMIDTSVLEPVREIVGQPYEIDREIGNWFNTKEEAELAVRKLKAWKRLKDEGFDIYSWEYEFTTADQPSQTIILRATAIDHANEDLDLLFGGEE